MPADAESADPAAARVALGVLLAAAAVVYAWNAIHVAPFSGFDAGGHAAYMLSIVEQGRLPHPLSGWSTFHPPLYYGIGAGLWHALEPFGPHALHAGLRGISALAMLAAGALAFALVRRRDGDWRLATVAAALVLFLPAANLAASWIGNEALGAGLAAAALPFVLRLQTDPGRTRDAALAGLFVGLALATKYTGVFVAIACAVPFLRADLDRRGLRSLAACALAVALVAGPAYVRHLATTGTPFPMTRTLEPMKSYEAMFESRARRLGDYLPVALGAIAKPYYRRHDTDERPRPMNPAFANVWAVAYTSLWFDPFGNRIPEGLHPRGVWAGPALVGLGLLPTGLALLGFAGAARETWRRRGRAPDAPLVAMVGAALALFVGFTWHAPAVAAAKGSYLLPLLAPGALLFARGVRTLPAAAQAPALALCLATAALAAAVFTDRLLFPPFIGAADGWELIGSRMPGTYIREAVERLVWVR